MQRCWRRDGILDAIRRLNVISGSALTEAEIALGNSRICSARATAQVFAGPCMAIHRRRGSCCGAHRPLMA